MKKDKEKEYKRNKGELAVKVMAGILAALMIISAFSTGIYYLFYYLSV